jgi:hypothetical protein
VDALSRTVGIPRTLEALREADVPALARAACREADTNYPVPRVMLQADCEALLRKVLPASVAAQPVGAPRAAAPRKAATPRAAARKPTPRKPAARKTTSRKTAPAAAARAARRPA